MLLKLPEKSKILKFLFIIYFKFVLFVLIMKIKTEGKTAKKALSEAISKIQKDLDKYKEEFKKAK